MKLPGKAWLQWETIPLKTGCRLVQTAMFTPRGLSGVVYWTLLYPLHKLIFRDLARSIVAKAEMAEKKNSAHHKKRGALL
jgi:hypothetical protein